MTFRSVENELKATAIVTALAEIYFNETIKIYLSNRTGFSVLLDKSGWKNIILDNYTLNNNVLSWIDKKFDI